MSNLLKAIIQFDFDAVADALHHVEETHQDFIIALRFVVSRESLDMLDLMKEYMDLSKVKDKKILAIAATKSLSVFQAITVDYSTQEFDEFSHPLVAACRVGNKAVVEHILELIRHEAFPVDDPHAVKNMALKMAGRGGHYAIGNMLIKNKVHAAVFIASLLVNGHEALIIRMADHPIVDFSYNNYEILKLCSAHIDVMMAIARHPTVANNYEALPADYYRHIVDMSVANFISERARVKNIFKKKIHRTAGHILTGATTAEKEKAIHEKFDRWNPPFIPEYQSRTTKIARVGAAVKDAYNKHQYDYHDTMASYKLIDFVYKLKE